MSETGSQFLPFVPLRRARSCADRAERNLLIARMLTHCDEIEERDRIRAHWNGLHPDDPIVADALDLALSRWAREAREWLAKDAFTLGLRADGQEQTRTAEHLERIKREASEDA